MTDTVQFILEVLTATAIQMLVLFGPLLAVGFLISVFEKFSNRMLIRTFGVKAVIYLTGWLGTTVHESGHAFFCLVFGHRIHKFVPFKPEQTSSGGYRLGYVRHSCKGTLWNNIGYLFIGTGPIIFGSAIIALLIRFLLPGGSDFFGDLHSTSSSLDPTPVGFGTMFVETIRMTGETIFWSEGWHTFARWEFWLFVALASSISLHMSLSRPDLDGAWKGTVFMAVSLMALNILFVAIGKEGFSDEFSAYVLFCAGVLFVGAMLSFLTLVFILAATAIIPR